MDEVGKYPFSAAFKAAEPAFKGANGWRAVPILVGTGHLIKVKMLRILFIIQKQNNFLAIQDEASNRKTGLFLSGVYRQDCKVKMSLAHWLRETRGMDIPKGSDENIQ
jgi:hypothetical protein